MKGISSCDIKSGKKIENNQPEDFSEGGLLRLPDSSISGTETEPFLKEFHNSGHALWYLQMMAYALIHDKSRWNDGCKTERIIAHLSCLREFIPNEDMYFKSVLRHLLTALKAEFPDERSQWLDFLARHWELLRCFAHRYNLHDQCFPTESGVKIKEILEGKHYLRVWWWRFKAADLSKQCMLRAGNLWKTIWKKRKSM